MFRQFTLLCRELNLFGRELLAVDGARIKAVNNKDRNFTTGSLQKFIEAVAKKLEDYLKRLDAGDAEECAGCAWLDRGSFEPATHHQGCWGGEPMKAYRKFKLPEATGPPAKVANPAKVRTHEPETLATLAAGNAQTTKLGGKPNDGAPPEPDEAELEERKGMAMGGVPGSKPGAAPWPEPKPRKSLPSA